MNRFSLGRKETERRTDRQRKQSISPISIHYIMERTPSLLFYSCSALMVSFSCSVSHFNCFFISFQPHDSYAAFRSQNLSLNVSYEVEADKLKVENNDMLASWPCSPPY